VTALSKYPKQVFWSDEDEGFVAVVPDLPGCSAIGDTEADALTELESAIAAWIDAATSVGNKVPAPSNPAQHNYSGKLLVRMPRSLHKDLVSAADKESVSLNQFIVYVLSMHSTLRAQIAVYPSAHADVKLVDGRNLSPIFTNNTSIKAITGPYITITGPYITEAHTVSSGDFFSLNITSPSAVQYVEPTRWEVEMTQTLEKNIIMSKALANSPLMLRTISNRKHGE
jgi:predicted RNase H-like HicB family nuclease